MFFCRLSTDPVVTLTSLVLNHPLGSNLVEDAVAAGATTDLILGLDRVFGATACDDV